MSQRLPTPLAAPKSQEQQDTDFTSEGAPTPPVPAAIPVKVPKATKAALSSARPSDRKANPPSDSDP